MISDGQRSIRKAAWTALPDVSHQLCHFHYLWEAAKPVYEADRHAKKELKEHIRGVRPLERAVEKRDDAEAEVAFPFALLLLNAINLLALVGAPEIRRPVEPLIAAPFQPLTKDKVLTELADVITEMQLLELRNGIVAHHVGNGCSRNLTHFLAIFSL